tara:strand:+ start:815 stop:1069 length:255 start_codon:yes stop_codon:yes gene_type:complete
MYIIYGKKLCNYCNKATNLLQREGLGFTYHSMDNKQKELLSLFTIYNWRTVPLIVEVKDAESNFVGGYDDLIKRLQIKISEEND